jgi:hypothetical protein
MVFYKIWPIAIEKNNFWLYRNFKTSEDYFNIDFNNHFVLCQSYYISDVFVKNPNKETLQFILSKSYEGYFGHEELTK